VAEKFAFQQSGGDRSAVELHERAALARAQFVNGSRNQLFARAGFTADQDGRVGRCDRSDFFQYVAKRLALADDVGEIVFRADFIFKIGFLLREFVLQSFDLLKRQCIFNSNGDLVRDELEEVNIRFLKCRWLLASENQCPEFPSRRGQRQLAMALHPVFLHVLGNRGPPGVFRRA